MSHRGTQAPLILGAGRVQPAEEASGGALSSLLGRRLAQELQSQAEKFGLLVLGWSPAAGEMPAGGDGVPGIACGALAVHAEL